MTNDNKEVLSPDYYAILTDPNSQVVVNDIRFIRGVLIVIDNKYTEYKTSINKAILYNQTYYSLDPKKSKEILDKLSQIMDLKKEKLKKDIIVSGHLANISSRSNIRTAIFFYNNLKNSISQQLDLAFSLIISRLKNLSNQDLTDVQF